MAFILRGHDEFEENTTRGKFQLNLCWPVERKQYSNLVVFLVYTVLPVLHNLSRVKSYLYIHMYSTNIQTHHSMRNATEHGAVDTVVT